MGWGPLHPASVDFSDAAAPAAPDYGDIYHSRAGALGQARHVFLGGNALPARWAGRRRFVVLETGFGLGNNFLATWDAWRSDPARCAELHYVAIEKHPLRRDDLARAHAASPLRELADALLAQWPPPTPDLHLIDFAQGRLRLLLAFGDIAQVLPDLVAQVDAFYLDGFAPPRNPAMWDGHRLRSSLPRLAAADATLATWSAARPVREALQAAGFAITSAQGFADKREMTVGRHAPRFVAPRPPGRQWSPGTEVAVIGAGLAGAGVARALAARGIATQVFDRREQPASEGSGQPGGLFHGIVHGADGGHARWLRAAAVHTARVLQPLLDAGLVPGRITGLQRGERAMDATQMRALLAALALPADYVQVRSGAALGRSAAGGATWFYPGGGWVAPRDLVACWLRMPGITLRLGQAVQQLQCLDGRWQLLGDGGRLLASVDRVVLANAGDAQRLLGEPGWPLQRLRGQSSLLAAQSGADLPSLPTPIADGGYVLPLPGGGLLVGATSSADDDDAAMRDDDHRHNLDTLRRLTGWSGHIDPRHLSGRVGWRLQADDRLPLLGAVPLASAELAALAPRRLDAPRFVPRRPGLFVFTALGSRGISQAALGGEVLAAWLSGAPLPLPASLLDALDPARFIARAQRRPR